jgi:nicotinamidase-related amidase
MAGNLGFETYLVSDATAAFELTGHDGRKYSAQEIHDVTLATLNGEFATVIDTDALLQAKES